MTIPEGMLPPTGHSLILTALLDDGVHVLVLSPSVAEDALMVSIIVVTLDGTAVLHRADGPVPKREIDALLSRISRVNWACSVPHLVPSDVPEEMSWEADDEEDEEEAGSVTFGHPHTLH